MSEAAAAPDRLTPRRRPALREEALALAVGTGLAVLPIVYSGYAIYILPQYMLYGVLAMSLALLWGYAGILSFGQAGFFAIGAYAMGLAMKASMPLNSAYVGLLCSLLVGAAVAAPIGYFLFKAGVRDAYFVLVTLALSIIIEQVAVSQSQWTGGWNGMFLTRMSLSFGPFGEVSLYNDAPMYYFVLAIVALVYFILRRIVSGKFGKVLVGIRENESRLEALGYETALYKTAAFALSGAIACFAGALYGTHAGFVAPSLGGVLFSTEVVVWVAIAGRSSLLAALLGGVAVSLLSNLLSALMPTYWQLVIGLLFIAVIGYFRGGIAGALPRLAAGFRSGRR